MSQSAKSLIDELHRRIGRSVRRFQGIALSLRLMLPYLHPNGGAQDGVAARSYRAKHIDGKSPGLLACIRGVRSGAQYADALGMC